MSRYTYEQKMLAHYGDGFVIVPDQVAADQKQYDRAYTSFTAKVCDATGRMTGANVWVRLDGAAYGLWTSGTGDMRVTFAPPKELREIKERIVVNDSIAHQPNSGHGFRKGTWTYLLDGVAHKIWTSVPHNIDCDRQYDMVATAAAWAVLRADSVQDA